MVPIYWVPISWNRTVRGCIQIVVDAIAEVVLLVPAALDGAPQPGAETAVFMRPLCGSIIVSLRHLLRHRFRTRMELAHFGRVEIQIFFKKADFFRPVVQEFLITL